MRVGDLFARHPQVRRIERVQDPQDADLLVLDALRELGCDPEEPRGVRHYVYVPDRAGAAELSDELERDDWDTAVNEDDHVCLVVASRTERLTEPLVRRTRARLELLAAEYGGEYDGWEVETA